MKNSVITLKRSIHESKEVIELEFTHSQGIIEVLHQTGYARYEPDCGIWYIPASIFNLGEVFKLVANRQSHPLS